MEIKNDKLTMWRVVVPKLWGKVVFTLPCHHTMTGLSVRITDNNNSPHGKFHGFLSAFSNKFSDLNFASYVLCNYPGRGGDQGNTSANQTNVVVNQSAVFLFFRTNQNLAGKHFEGGQRSLKEQIVTTKAYIFCNDEN